MNQKTKNAISIKFKILMNSISIRLSLVLMFILSVGVAFWPYISNIFDSNDFVSIETNINFEDLEKYNLKRVDSDANIRITFENEMYTVDVLDEDGYKELQNITNLIKENNILNVVRNGKLSNEQIVKITNQNIKVNLEYENKLGQNGYDFLMAFVLIYNFLIILLISRIGAQVAYEKGNKLTEVILTSLSREQLYFSQVFASILVVIINLVVVSIPIIVAFIINDPNITTDLSFFSFGKIIQFIVHLVVTTISLIILDIGLSSRVKQSEDVNAYTAAVIIPLYFSLLYLVFKMNIFEGVFYILNYIPIASMFPVLGAILNESLSRNHFIVIELVTILLIICEYFLMKRMYTKSISRK